MSFTEEFHYLVTRAASRCVGSSSFASGCPYILSGFPNVQIKPRQLKITVTIKRGRDMELYIRGMLIAFLGTVLTRTQLN